MLNKMTFNTKKNDVLRVTSGVALLVLISLAILKSLLLSALIIFLIFIGMVREWYSITSSSLRDFAIGLFVIFVSISSIFIIRLLGNGSEILLWYMVIIGSYDTFAMYIGRFVGGAKIAPKTSPMKTWSGFWGGLYFACLFSSILIIILNSQVLEPFINFSEFYIFKSHFFFRFGIIFPTTIIVVLAHLGDYFESYFKRKYNVKDSGSIIPGHGGVLDRFDSILFSAPFLLLITLYLDG